MFIIELTRADCDERKYYGYNGIAIDQKGEAMTFRSKGDASDRINRNKWALEQAGFTTAKIKTAPGRKPMGKRLQRRR